LAISRKNENKLYNILQDVSTHTHTHTIIKEICRLLMLDSKLCGKNYNKYDLPKIRFREFLTLYFVFHAKRRVGSKYVA